MLKSTSRVALRPLRSNSLRSIRGAAAALLFLLLSGTPAALFADGWIEIDPHSRRGPHRPHPHPVRPTIPRMEVTKHHVSIDLDRGFAAVNVDETFFNPHGRDLEGTYYFPVPPGAQIEDFRATLGGKELAGEILPADEARQIYEQLVRRVIDPALLEYYRRDLFRARIFPIPARGDVSLQISYRHRVPSNGGLQRLRYPLDTGRFAQGPYRDVKIDVNVTTDGVLHAVDSPSHPLTEVSRTQKSATLRYTAATLEARHDFLLDVVEGNGQLAGGIRAFQEVGEDGWFVLRLVPGREDAAQLPPTTLILVVDTSGSMAGQKLEHTKEAIRTTLARLRPVDRFQILTFSSRVSHFAEAPVAATEGNVNAAIAMVNAMKAQGGTNLDDAIRSGITAAQAEDRLSTVLLMTDGAPTVGVTDIAEIRRRAQTENGGDLRLHVLGVGERVNTKLLDALAKENRGSRSYVFRSNELEVLFSSLIDRVLYPAISDLQLRVEGVNVSRLEPSGPWDLFHGDDLIVAGRFTGSGPARVIVEGTQAGQKHAWTFPAEFPRHGGEDEAAYVWAELRILQLLEQLRDQPSQPAALQEELVALSLRYGIVTPYTSYLIREAPRGLLSERLGRVVGMNPELRERSRRRARGFDEADGADALDYAKELAEARRRAGRGGEAAGTAARPSGQSIDRDLGVSKRRGKTFHPVGDGETIVDADLGGLAQLPEPDLSFPYLSDEYWAFLNANPGVESILARGRSMLFRWQGKIVRIDDDPEAIAPVPEPVPESSEEEETPKPPKKKVYFQEAPGD